MFCSSVISSVLIIVISVFETEPSSFCDLLNFPIFLFFTPSIIDCFNSLSSSMIFVSFSIVLFFIDDSKLSKLLLLSEVPFFFLYLFLIPAPELLSLSLESPSFSLDWVIVSVWMIFFTFVGSSLSLTS